MKGFCDTGVKKSVELTRLYAVSNTHGTMETSGESSRRMWELILDNNGMSSDCLTLQAHPFLSTNFVRTKSEGSPIDSGSKVRIGMKLLFEFFSRGL